MTGFEPAASESRTRRSTNLSYTLKVLYVKYTIRTVGVKKKPGFSGLSILTNPHRPAAAGRYQTLSTVPQAAQTEWELTDFGFAFAFARAYCIL